MAFLLPLLGKLSIDALIGAIGMTIAGTAASAAAAAAIGAGVAGTAIGLSRMSQ